MKVRIHEMAVMEFEDAIQWYDLQSNGLGSRFKDATLRLIDKIKDTPKWFLKETKDIYKAYIPKFPYKILYTVEEDGIVIWAIAHLHRKPWYWQSRMN
jgi:hypothetical protein